ncbi:MAG: calcium-binding protein [Actinomycetota bacterium]
MTRRLPTLGLVLSVCVLLVPLTASPALAAPGDLDPTFDTDGKVTTDFGGNDQAADVAVQADGKIVVAGTAVPGVTLDFGVSRYNPNGSLDPAFDTDGKVTTDFAGNNELGVAVAIQDDGKIVVAGATVGTTVDFALARYNANGSLDATFDTDGKVTTDFAGGSDQAVGVAIQDDGKIVAAGFASADLALARYNTNGSLDTTFDTDGKVTTDFGGNDVAADVAVQDDGKIVAAGNTDVLIVTGDWALARYNSNGSLDGTFDTDGKVITSFAGGNEGIGGIGVQTDGKIVAAGVAGGSDFGLGRYNTDGSLDTTFDTDGKVTTDFAPGNVDGANDVLVQGNGRIVAVGFAPVGEESPNDDFALARYDTDGSLDPTFHSDGKVTTDFAGGEDEAYGAALQDDGKILAAGCSPCHTGTSADDWAVARYEGDEVEGPFTLDVSLAGTGEGGVKSTPAGIKCPTDCTHDYDADQEVTLQAFARPGSEFTGWGGDCAFAGAASMCTLTMGSDRDVTATFDLPDAGPHTLDVVVAGNGGVLSTPSGIRCPTDCMEDYAAGQEVTLTARARQGSSFSGWGGDCASAGAAQQCVLTMNSDKDVTATFALA